jgi:hypothetical protein
MNRHGGHVLFARKMKDLMPGIVLLVQTLLFPVHLSGQSNPQFDVSLQVDYSPAEQMLNFFDRQTFNSDRVANSRGNKIAAATSLLMARTERPLGDFAHQLELIRDDYNTSDDIYGLKATRSHIDQLRKLLIEIRKRQIDRRVIATVQSYFPSTIDLSGTIPVYVVAMGNERAAAFVRRIVWKDDNPVFVGDNEGEPVIVLNLTRMLEFSSDVNAQFIQSLGTLAHECFHAVFSLYQQNSQTWREYHQRMGPIWQLAELVQNEGIAYLLSLQLQIGGQTPANQWFDVTSRAIKALNNASKELIAPSITSRRAHELILNSNMSGSIEGNYGATAGQRMAYEIDTRLGRPALTETIRGGVKEFFGKYDTLCAQNSNLPRLDPEVLTVLEQ